MKQPAAALTMVKDDYFFLQRWVDYYGAQFGRQALYVISHGGDPEIASIATSCNVITIPAGFDKTFDMKRWRLLSHFANGLHAYFNFVICGDVDEFVVVDPKSGLDLAGFLAKRHQRAVLTPIGLEVIHRPDVETEPIGSSILAARRHCRYSSYYSKPCVIGLGAKLSRGGHYSDFSELKVFANLYLFHMKYGDRDLYVDTMRRRSELARQSAEKDSDGKAIVSSAWFVESGAEAEEIDRLAALPVRDDFEFAGHLEAMTHSWERRGENLWHFKKHVGTELHTIPDRFSGVV